MKITVKKCFPGFALLFVVGLLLFMFTLPAVEQETSMSPLEKEEQIWNKLDQMKMEIEAGGHTFSVGPNPAVRYDLSELCAFNPHLFYDGLYRVQADDFTSTATLPSSYIGFFTSVKNQGVYGLGWAVVCNGEFESVIKKQDGIDVDLSEQYLVSCNPYGWGCDGGAWAYDMFVDPGAVMESCFPFSGCDTPCNHNCPYPYVAQGWAFVNPNVSVPAVNEIKQAIYDYGAVGAAVYVDSFFQYYTAGVFDHCLKKKKYPNHMIQLVGWDDSKGEKGAWLLKNSWGTGWGESGFMWIAYNCNLVGYDANYVIY